MSHHRQARPRARRRSLHVELGLARDEVASEFVSEGFDIWIPVADDPLVIAGFGDASSFAFEIADWNVEREALALLDAQRRVTAILLDPPPQVGVLIGRCELPALEVPFCQTLSVVVADRPLGGPPSAHEREGYLGLRRIHMLQGLQLLDVLLVGADSVQSLAIACDPDPVWFDPFEPLVAVDPHGGTS